MKHRPIAEIEMELKEAKEAERKELEAKQRAVKPQYEFVLVPTSKLDLKVYDSTCQLFDLIGIVMNKAELRAVHKAVFEGSMTYVFSWMSKRFVNEMGGGSVFVDSPACWSELSKFIVDNPSGGNVTQIVSKYFPKPQV